MNVIDSINKQQLKTDVPEFSVGDTVRVHNKIIEGTTERIQIFTGMIIAISGKDVNKTITLRRVTFGQGVERVFPIHSPRIAKIEVERRADVKRAKLYYLRGKVGKGARIKEKRNDQVQKREVKAAE